MNIKYAHALAVGLVCMGLGAGPLVGCGDDDDNNASGDAGGDVQLPPPGEGGTTDATDGAMQRATVLAKGPSNGSSVALSQDESRLVVCNRDKGSVTVFSVVYGGAAPALTKVAEVDVGAGSEPWQVAIDPKGDRAYIALRQAQKLVRIDNLAAMPTKGPEAAVGSEPSGVALSPHGTSAYVANWVDGTVSVVDTQTMMPSKTINLNGTIAPLLTTGLATRPALAHPRSVAVTNNGDANDNDEYLYVTEYFGIRKEAEAADGSNADTSKQGLVYRVKLSNDNTEAITLSPLADMGFAPTAGATAGCYPNQLQSITLNGKYAYVLSVCASPRGPSGVRATAITCDPANGATDCAGAGNIAEGVCPAGATTCSDLGSVKTSTAPLLSVIDTSQDPPVEVTAAATSLNKRFFDRYTTAVPAVANDASRRLPLLANDLTFVPGTQIGYISANGTNAVFRIVADADGTLKSVGSDTPLKHFIDLTLGATQDFANATHGLLPTGVVAGSKNTMFVANDVSRNVSVVDLATQTVAGGATPVVVASSTKDAAETSKLKGKLFFNTGLGRWSLRGQGWGACQACHTDGLTDNVTWYFGRGPRQSVSLDGSFSANGSVQRIFNWTAVFDDVADFEGNTRGTSGGVGAIVKDKNPPLANTQRIDQVTACTGLACDGQRHDGLNGSAKLIADAKVDQFVLTPNESKIDDWADVEAYLKTIRSPRGATGLDANKVKAGRTLFEQNKCNGCHGGALWTTSELFYTRTAANAFTTTEALSTTSWDIATFPLNITPVDTSTTGTLRSGANTGNDSILCALRHVGSFGVSETDVGVVASNELRQDMVTAAQGGNPAARGFSPPSLLGVSVGAPFLHAGNARTLEGLFSDTFIQHHRALSANFLTGADADDRRAEIISFLLSIEDATTPATIPAAGASGGKLCAPPF